MLIFGGIDNVCIESLSIDLTRPMLDLASKSVQALSDKIVESVSFRSTSDSTLTALLARMKANDAEKLEEEYAKLLEGLQAAGDHNEEDDFMANPSTSPPLPTPHQPS